MRSWRRRSTSASGSNRTIALSRPHRRTSLAPWQAHEKALDTEIARLNKMLKPLPKDASKEDVAKQKALDEAIKAAKGKRLPHPFRIAWVADLGPEAVSTPLFIRGNASTPGPLVAPGVPAFLVDPDNPYEVPSAGRRGSIHRPAASPGALVDPARLASLGAPGAGPGQSDLAAPLRHGPLRHVRQPGLYRLDANAS